MTTRTQWLACLFVLGAALPGMVLPGLALADLSEAPDTQVPQQAGQPVTSLPEPARVIALDNPGGWADPPGEVATREWESQNPWGYGTDYIFPLTRGIAEMDLPLWAKIPLYPFSGAADLIQLPAGALAGLWGN